MNADEIVKALPTLPSDYWYTKHTCQAAADLIESLQSQLSDANAEIAMLLNVARSGAGLMTPAETVACAAQQLYHALDVRRCANTRGRRRPERERRNERAGITFS